LQPVVSVILPTYDRVTLLRDAVESVRAQTFGAWELLVVDDGSTDGTGEYLRSAGREDPRVRLIEMPHGGNIARLRNRGAAEAAGRYLAFQDSDDLWAPEKLESQLAALADAPGARWCYCAAQGLLSDGRPDEAAGPVAPVPVSGWILDALVAQTAGVTVPSVVLERALFDQVGGFDESFQFGEDHDLWLRLAEAAPCVGLPQRLVTIRQHAGQTTRSSATPAVAAMIAVLEKFIRRTSSPRLRRLARRTQARQAVHAAWGWYARGRRVAALLAVAGSIRYDRGRAVGGEVRRIGSRVLQRAFRRG
jgi:glycosyltransferase involved in cell wall biosynthesis